MADVKTDDAPLPTTVVRQNNPYSGSSKCTPLEAEVLGEYVRLADNIERLTAITNELATQQPELLDSITPLERKLGMVMTLFKASVWSTYMARQDAEEEELNS